MRSTPALRRATLQNAQRLKAILRLWLQLGGNAASLQWAGRAELDDRRHPQSHWRGRRRAGRGEGYRRDDTQNRGDYLVIAEFSGGSQASYRTASTRFDQPIGQQRTLRARRALEHRRRQNRTPVRTYRTQGDMCQRLPRQLLDGKLKRADILGIRSCRLGGSGPVARFLECSN